jgi:hypothetical protein
MNTNEKISRELFDENFEIIFSEEKTLFPGTIRVEFGQREILLKDKSTGKVYTTGLSSNSKDYGELLVYEAYCTIG